MKTVERLDWILDKDDESISNDEKYRLNIEFVHSLGLKCDCVGWSTLDLHNPRADEILSAIDSFCKKNGWRARGIYTRNYTDFSSDWYELIPVTLKENTNRPRVPRAPTVAETVVPLGFGAGTIQGFLYPQRYYRR